MGISWSEISRNANGGTEQMARELERRVAPELLEQTQIILSRELEALDETKLRIFWGHDLAHDPAAEAALKNGRWKRYHRIVLPSYWSAERYAEYLQIPWERIVVLRNAINPITVPPNKAKTPIRLVYASTPHRGLELLYPVFARLAEKYDDIELDVFSSFALYGWPDNDKRFEPLFEKLKAHPKIRYHGARPNEEVRDAMSESHILAYPSIYPETSCITLMQGMSAGLVCVHPGFAGLPETAANLTFMYGFQQDPKNHEAVFQSALEAAIAGVREGGDDLADSVMSQKLYADHFYGWNRRAREWTAFLESIKDLPRAMEKVEDAAVFSYRTG